MSFPKAKLKRFNDVTGNLVFNLINFFFKKKSVWKFKKLKNLNKNGFFLSNSL